MNLTESTLCAAAVEWFGKLAYEARHGVGSSTLLNQAEPRPHEHAAALVEGH